MVQQKKILEQNAALLFTLSSTILTMYATAVSQTETAKKAVVEKFRPMDLKDHSSTFSNFSNAAINDII